jgi:hypothetical protein
MAGIGFSLIRQIILLSKTVCPKFQPSGLYANCAFFGLDNIGAAGDLLSDVKPADSSGIMTKYETGFFNSTSE